MTSSSTDHPLGHALGELGRQEEARRAIIASCLRFEHQPEQRFSKARQEITGPIVDALHARVGPVRKVLDNGLVFEFLYRSQIARDFVMAEPERPTHVWEPQTTRLLLHLAADARHVIVGGAYFGDQAIVLAHRIAAHGGVVHAFEPDAGHAAMLQRNAELNHLGNIRSQSRCLWSDSKSKLCFAGTDALASTVVAPADDPSPGLATVTIDDYLAEQGIPAVQVIALDVEGGEPAILRGAERQLSLPPDRAPHLVFEVHRSYVDWSNGLLNTDLLKYLTSLGYSSFAIRDFQSNYDLSSRPIELVPPETAYLEGPPHGFNMLATKTPRAVSGEGFLIQPGVSPKLLRHGNPALHHPVGGLP
jgi:FkbM family methyltransferase